MTDRAEPTCSSCPSWLADVDSVPIGQPDGLPTDGECRRYPPPRSDGQWPTTNSDGWCGEHPERVRSSMLTTAKSPGPR